MAKLQQSRFSCAEFTIDEFRERSALLDRLLLEAGRQPNEVRRTMTLALFCSRDPAELEQRVSGLRHIYPPLTDLPPDTLLETFSTWFKGTIAGTPDQVVKQIRVYDELGVDELMIHWFCLDDIEGLHLLAEHVLPYTE